MSFYNKLKNNKFQNEVFHVHTYRCTHASYDSDEDYVKSAIEIGSKKITFTDHAPFPGDPFYSRMSYFELDNYINDIKELKKKYEGIIDINVGLEIEYLPTFNDYYYELKDRLDTMLLGQHIFEVEKGKFNFKYNLNKDEKLKGFIKGMIDGVNTGLFDVVAHPDRHLTDSYFYDEEFDNLYKILFQSCNDNNTVIEYNLSSAEYSDSSIAFWNTFPFKKNKIIIGCDAHCIYDIKCFDGLIKVV